MGNVARDKRVMYLYMSSTSFAPLEQVDSILAYAELRPTRVWTPSGSTVEEMIGSGGIVALKWEFGLTEQLKHVSGGRMHICQRRLCACGGAPSASAEDWGIGGGNKPYHSFVALLGKSTLTVGGRICLARSPTSRCPP